MGKEIVANWNFLSNNYGIKLSTDSSVSETYITFDTGAAVTVLGCNMLFDLGITESRSELAIMRLLTISGITPRVFYSATKTEMLGYPCVIENMKLSGVVIDKFYFYLFLGGDNPDVSLLGNDFLKYCEYTKKLDSDIVITDFNNILYESNFLSETKSKRAFPVNLILDELERIESTKDLASAFRYIISHPTR